MQTNLADGIWVWWGMVEIMSMAILMITVLVMAPAAGVLLMLMLLRIILHEDISLSRRRSLLCTFWNK